MKVDFLGICMFDSQQPVLEALLPNVANGLPDHPAARPHHAFIAVPPDTVNHDDWGAPVVQQVVALQNQTFWTFALDGVGVSFDPPPGGGPSTINIAALPLTLDMTGGSCPDKTNLRADVDTVLSARVSIPGGPLHIVPVQVVGAPAGDDIMFYTELTVDDDVTVIATGPGGVKSLKMLSPGGPAEIYIANVDLVPVDVNDMADRALFCVMFEEEPQVAAAATRSKGVSGYSKRASRAAKGKTLVSTTTTTKTTPPPHRGVRLATITLGPGCSNTQWP